MSVRKYIKDYKFYDGLDADKSISASSFSKDILELYLAETENPQRPVFGRGEIGSIFHLGMEQMFKQHHDVKSGSWIQERRFTKAFLGWKVNGKMDMVNFHDDTIFDWKGMSAYTYGLFSGKDKSHKINVQMSVYNWLLGGGFSAEAHCFITDFDPVKETHPASAYQIVHVELMTLEETEAYMTDKLNRLESALAAKKQPAECEDVMPRYVKKGVYVNAKCAYYCDYAHVCKRKKDQTAKVLGLSWGK